MTIFVCVALKSRWVNYSANSNNLACSSHAHKHRILRSAEALSTTHSDFITTRDITMTSRPMNDDEVLSEMNKMVRSLLSDSSTPVKSKPNP